MPLTQQNRLNFLPQVLNISEASAEVNFTLKRGADYQNIGRNNLGVSTRLEQQIVCQYGMTMPDLCPEDYQTLKNFETSVAGDSKTFFVDDFSDNFVFEWSDEQGYVAQYGYLFPIEGTATHRMVKVYRCGLNYGIKPIYRFDSTAIVKVNDSTTGFTLDRTTGIFSGVTATGLLQATTDHYYTPVRFQAPIAYTHYYQRGWDNLLGVADPASSSSTGKPQKYKAVFNLIEQKYNEPLRLALNYSDPVYANPVTQPIILDVLRDVKDSSFEDDYRTRVYEHRGFEVTSNLPTRGAPSRKVTITADTVKHERLIYWSTIFRGCGGGSFDV